VALRAGDRGAEPHRARGVHPVDERLEARLLHVDPALLVELEFGEAGDPLLERRPGSMSPELLDREVAKDRSRLRASMTQSRYFQAVRLWSFS
jgi:hypothetical protein